MKKKLSSLLLAGCMMLGMLPTVAFAEEPTDTGTDTPAAETTNVAQVGETPYTSLQDAINNANGAEIDLLGNVSVDTLTPAANTVIDLNNYTLTYTNQGSIVLNNEQTMTISNGSLTATQIKNGTTALFNIKTNCAIELNKVAVDTNGAALYPQGDAASVTVTDSTIDCGVYAVATNAATVDNYNVIITLTNSTFNTKYGYQDNDGDSCPVMINIPGTLKMDDCTVNGTRQGVVVRGGDATISNSKINLVSDGIYASGAQMYLDEDWGSGDEVPMAGLVVGNRHSKSYAYPATCTLTNTTVTAPDSYKTVYMYGMNADTQAATLSYDAASIVGTIEKNEAAIVNAPIAPTTDENGNVTISGTIPEATDGTVSIPATTEAGTAASANITIEAATAQALADAQKPVAIATDVATVQFDQTVMEKIQSAQSDVNLVVAKADVSKVEGIPADAAAVELKLVYKDTNGKETEIIPESGASTNGNVTVTLAYDKAYDGKTIGLYYIKENKPSLVGTAAVADGKATFTVNHFSTYAVAPIVVSGITLDKATAEIEVGKTVELKATVTPDNATDKTVTWTSSDEKVATVKDGVVTAVAAGKATITAKAGDKTATCEVTVKEAPKPVDPAEDELLQPDPSCDGKDKCPTAKYNDLKNKDAKVWYHQAVDFVVLNEIMIGTTKDSKNLVWGLGQTISRAEIAQIMYNMTAAEGYEAPKKATFTDVPVDEWYFKAVEWANTDGCMVGTGEGKFEPTRAVTRQEYAAVMYRIVTKGMSATEKKEFDTACNAVKLDAFTDSKQIDNWAVTGVKMCVASEIMKGNEYKQLMPKKGATREEAAQMIMNFLNMEEK